MDDETIKGDEELDPEAPLDEELIDGKKKPPLLDDEVESADELADEEELEEDEPFDDVNPL